MKNLTKILHFVIISITLSSIGWNSYNKDNAPKNITNYYFYKNKPFYLTLKSDRLFIKLNKTISETDFRQIVSEFNAVLNSSIAYVPEDRRYFIDLMLPASESELNELISGLMSNQDVQYVSPVFSPDNGRTLIGVEDEIIVQFKPSYTTEHANHFIQSRNLTVIQEVSLSGGLTYVLRVPRDQSAIDVANEIHNSGVVNWSEPNLLFTNVLCYDPNDPFYSMQWSLKNLGNNIPGGITGTPDCDMDVDSAWNTTLGISQCRIAISDTGVDTLHEDLAANMVVGSGWNFWNNTPGAMDDNAHGTACAGIAAGIGNNSIGVSGVAPNCKIIPVKWLSSGGSGNYTGASNATIWAYQRGAWVISNSWGFVGGASSMLDNAISDAVTFGRGGKGSIFVVASGNENGAMRFPASTNPNCLVVGGISPCNQRKSPSSCDLESWGASFGSNLDVVAPCVKVYTTDRTGSPGYSSGNYFATFNGTSSATPNVAGVCALALSVDSTMRWDTLRVRVDRTCEKRGSYSYTQPGPRGIGQWNNEMGYGLVNARLLLAILNPPPASTCNFLASTWVGRPNLPTASFYGSSAWIGDTMYYHSPTTTGTPAATIYRYTYGGSWTTGVPLPASLVGGIMVSAGGRLYYIGGSTTGVTTGGTAVYQYNPSTGAWATVAPLPVALSGHNAVNWGDSVIIVVGGPWTGSGTNLAHHYYNIGTNTWGTTTTSLPSGQGRRSFAMGISGSRIVISSGFNTVFLKSTYIGTIGSNAATITWTAAPDVPTVHTGLSRPGGTAYGNYFFIVCGERGGIGGYYDTTHVLNIATNTWVGIINNVIFPRSNIWGHVTNRCISDTLSLFLPAGYGGTGVATDLFHITRGGTPVGVINPPVSGIPERFELSQNYPNPFNPRTTISFSLPKMSFVTLKVYDITGREVKTLINEIRGAGKWEVVFDAGDLASGVYFYTLKAEGFEKTNKMMLVK